MLPNACFPLFPVVDYKTFRRNYYDDDAYRIYQTGVDWMLRGVIHLLLYRLVYYHLTLAPAEVTSPELLMQYLATNFVLYLKISGLFHMIVGMLYLFGFRLPETNNRYFLAAGVTDSLAPDQHLLERLHDEGVLLPGAVQAEEAGANTASSSRRSGSSL